MNTQNKLPAGTKYEAVLVHAAIELGFDADDVENILRDANITFRVDGATKCWQCLCDRRRFLNVHRLGNNG